MPSVDFEIEHSYVDDPTTGIVLPVELLGSSTIRCIAHVDTGAADCLFQSAWAELLGLALTDGNEKIFAPAGGGSIIAFGHEITFRVLGKTVSSVVYFTDHPQFTRNVLGRRGWLHHFKFGLVHYDSKLYLGSYGE